jgi:hypothetical protein
MPEKHPNTARQGGPGASHENRKEPQKSKPHGELNKLIQKKVIRNAIRPAKAVVMAKNIPS